MNRMVNRFRKRKLTTIKKSTSCFEIGDLVKWKYKEAEGKNIYRITHLCFLENEIEKIPIARITNVNLEGVSVTFELHYLIKVNI